MANDRLNNIVNHFAIKLAADLTKSVNDVVKRKSGTPVDIEFNPKIEVSDTSAKLQIIASESYWYWIEHGRKKGRQPPSSVVGKDWQTKAGINAQKAIYEIQVNYNQKHHLKRTVKKIQYNKAAKTLSFLIARSIGKHGVKPRPFIDRVTKDGRMEQFKKDLAQAIGKDIQLNITDVNHQ